LALTINGGAQNSNALPDRSVFNRVIFNENEKANLVTVDKVNWSNLKNPIRVNWGDPIPYAGYVNYSLKDYWIFGTIKNKEQSQKNYGAPVKKYPGTGSFPHGISYYIPAMRDWRSEK